MSWWEEIKATGSPVNVCFGGPTGMYNLVVLVSWWCSLLKDRPDAELTDYLRTLEDIDRVVLSAICDTDSSSIPASSCGVPSPGASTPPLAPQPRGSKRTIPHEELSSNKRPRRGKV